ncbi:PREDICTED: uncharacterized mitochondrial protein AtMg00860-like [Priapulus caudatus]|uniref:Uncharacterized mitochondrial protein AtMg00860-like n=1 Tax=Priapulus caudatus TaxID=37621 RepID=A0ABM1EMI1_PRICU|nr:PREDICTED: uncharacterized mitochondrial protein AtMg00860-like [Priapulus caudatus]
MRDAGLIARPSKFMLGYSKLKFLGHKVGGGNVGPQDVLVSRIQNAPVPQTKQEVRAFMGLAGYYRKYIPNFATIAAPLTDLTRNGQPNKIRLGQAQENTFLVLKRYLLTNPILRLPDMKILYTAHRRIGYGNRSDFTTESNGELFPVSYASKRLCPREKA